MSDGTYRIHIYLVGLDKDRAKELRYVMHDFVRGAGKTLLRDMMRRAHEGEKVLVYQTNDDKDAEAVTRALKRAGAQLEVAGLRGEEEPF
jgi:hypothetical protein